MAARLLLAAVAALALPAVPALAQGKKYALLVGVKDYDHADFAALKYTENDAEELAVVLKDAGYTEVVLLTSTRGKKQKALSPSAANIRTQLKKLTDKVTRDDLLLVGFAGHGLQWPVVESGTKREKDESFFCPADARPRSDQTIDELKKTMIPLTELFRTLDESGAGVRLMLVDACRNEVKGAKRNVDVDNLPRTKKGTAVLFSCKGGETANETGKLGKGHGVFFYHVIQGLKGEAKDRRGQVTWTTLADHVIEKVSEDVPVLIGGGAKQTPHEMRNIEGRSPLLVEKVAVKKDAEADRLYREGVEVYLGLKEEIDHEKALRLFRRAADRGHVPASAFVGWMQHQGSGMEPDVGEGLKKIKAALPALRQLAEGGDADAQSVLGALFGFGVGVEKDPKEAGKWFRKAADQGDLGATYNLGAMYLNGLGVEKDEKVAAELVRKAADKGLPFALTAMGGFYLAGQGGVRQDPKEALRWFQKAIDKGDPGAMFGLAGMHLQGLGVRKDDREAAKWLQKAADKGDAQSMALLGAMYLTGRGVKADLKEAVRWLRKGAEKGNDLAMFQLGAMYEFGEGVPMDRAEALKWYKKAAALGSEDAKKKVQELDR